MENESSLIFAPKIVFIFLALFFSTVNSQSSDSCSTNFTANLNGAGTIPFDPSNFICNSVWTSQNFILRFRQTSPSQWSFLLSAPNTNGYIAMGFSSDGQMIGSSAIAGWVGTDTLTVIRTYFLGGQSPSQVVPNSGNLAIGNSATIVATSTRIFIAFQLNSTMPETRVLYAVGSPGQIPSPNGFQLSYHADRVSTSVDYTTGQSQTTSSPYSRLKRSHGILNLIGWGILMPIGIIVARYMRQWDPVWFYSHTAIQSLGFILGVAGVISGLVLEDRLGVSVKKHKAIGITVLVLGCLQAIAVLARPDKESKVRKYWNWYHHNAGRILIVLAVANVFYGVHLAKSGKSWNAGFGSALIILFVTSVILEIRLHMKK